MATIDVPILEDIYLALDDTEVEGYHQVVLYVELWNTHSTVRCRYYPRITRETRMQGMRFIAEAEWFLESGGHRAGEGVTFNASSHDVAWTEGAFKLTPPLPLLDAPIQLVGVGGKAIRLLRQRDIAFSPVALEIARQFDFQGVRRLIMADDELTDIDFLLIETWVDCSVLRWLTIEGSGTGASDHNEWTIIDEWGGTHVINGWAGFRGNGLGEERGLVYPSIPESATKLSVHRPGRRVTEVVLT